MPSGSDPSGARPARVLLAVLVYNGEAFVPACIESASRVTSDRHDVDVIVLDDCSPEPGLSDRFRTLAGELGVGYYRSPRNLGIPRNMNIAMLRAAAAGYDHVILCNSDVVVPANLVDAMVGVVEADPSIGSVTAWSNNVSIFSLPNDDPDANLAHQGAVDFISAALHGEFGTESVDLPSGVGFCMLIPTDAIREVGICDPVFGRGYCEEVDWCQRALQVGRRSVLAPSAFVYHIGNATTHGEGMLLRGHTSVLAHERIIDMRYPDYRGRVEAFGTSGLMGEITDRALRRIVVCAAREWGYSVDASWLPYDASPQTVRFVVTPDGRRPLVAGMFQGFRASVDIVDAGVLDAVEKLVGRPPSGVSLFERGRLAELLAEEAAAGGVPFTDRRPYPERI